MMNARHSMCALLAMMMIIALSACGSVEGTLAAGVGGVTALGGRAPSHEIEQTYYLGVFDPEEQVPPALYRVRVNGQSALFNDTNYSSGWVPAYIADSLGANLEFDRETSELKIDGGAAEHRVNLKTGKRLMMFGPEGFREAPADHRLVIVMGSNPDDYFNALSETLGEVSDEVVKQRTLPDRDKAAVGGAFISADKAIAKTNVLETRGKAMVATSETKAKTSEDSNGNDSTGTDKPASKPASQPAENAANGGGN